MTLRLPRWELWPALRHRWALVSLATLFYWFAAHSLRPLVTLRLDELGASDAQIGLVVAAYPLCSLFLAVPAGRLVDRLGVLRILALALTAMALVGAGYAMATTTAHILVLQAANGVVELFVWLALQALVTHAGTGAFRTRQLSLFSLAWGIGLAAGPVLGSWVFALAGFRPLGWVYAGLSLGAFVALAVPRRDIPQPTPQQTAAIAPSREVIRRLLRQPAVKGVLLSSFVSLYVMSIRNSFYPLFLERSGVEIARIGLLLSAMGVASLAVRVLLPPLQRRFHAGRILLWSMWLPTIAMGLTPWLGAYPLLFVAAVVIGAGGGLNPPVTVELMAMHTRTDERGIAMGLRLTANRLAQVVQPLVFGGLVAVASVASAFPLSGLLLAAVNVAARVQIRSLTRDPAATARPAPPPGREDP